MEYTNRKSVNCDLNKFCYMAKKNSFIEVTEWTNEEGWDITIDNKIFSLTEGELDAINYLTMSLRFNEK